MRKKKDQTNRKKEPKKGIHINRKEEKRNDGKKHVRKRQGRKHKNVKGEKERMKESK